MYLMAVNCILKNQKMVYLYEVYFNPNLKKKKTRKKKKGKDNETVKNTRVAGGKRRTRAWGSASKASQMERNGQIPERSRRRSQGQDAAQILRGRGRRREANSQSPPPPPGPHRHPQNLQHADRACIQ